MTALPDSQDSERQDVSTWRKFGLVGRAGWKYLLRSAPGLCLCYMIAALGAAAAALGAARVIGDLVTTLQSQGGEAGAFDASKSLTLFATWILLILVGTPLLNMLHQYLGARIDQHVTIRLQNDTLRRVLGQPLPYFFKNRIASILNMLGPMCRETRHAIRLVVLDAPTMAVILAAGMGMVVERLHDITSAPVGPEMWAVIIVLLIAALATPMLVERFGKRLGGTEFDLIDKEEALGSLTRSGVQSAEELKAFGSVDWYAQRQKKRLEDVAVSDIHQTVTIEKVNFVNLLPSHVMQGLLIAAALLIAIRAGANTPQVGALVTLLMIVPQLMRPLQGASALLMTLHKSWPNIARVFGMLDRESEESSEPDPHLDPPVAEPAAVAVRDLSFRYDADGATVLDGASFDLAPGKVTGLVARMGAGKTTFFRLLMRFYQPASGTIEIDGKPLNEFTLGQLRREVTMMAQFPTFSPDSVRDNLLLAAPAASDDDLVHACQLAGIWPVLQRNFGEDLSAGELLNQPFSSGSGISGGQRKLFALGRCLLRSPRILLLDEPTTGIDNIEKFGLLDRLRDACRGRTVLVVDHDVRWLSEFCDEILVLEDGAIVDQGTPESLLRSQSLFRELHAQGESDAPEAPEAENP